MERKKEDKRRPGEIEMAKLLGAEYCKKDEILTPLKSGLIKQIAWHLITSVIRRLLFLPLRILGC